MKDLPAGLQAHLDTGATTLAWCWRLTRADGAVYGFTDHDEDLTFDATVFEAATGFTGTDFQSSIGLSVDNLDVSGALKSGCLAETDLAAGLFDGAKVEIWRANWAAADQRVLIMSGSIGEVKRGQTAFSAELRSLAHSLDQDKGRIYQYACDACLGDGRCTVNASASAYRADGTVAAVQTPYMFTASGLGSFGEGWFSGGEVVWTSGNNSSHRMEVRRHSLTTDGSVEIELWRSMTALIAAGDAFAITAGCDKTFATCRTKFANGVNFRGFPHIPGNSYVLATPSPGDPANDGGSIA